MQEKSIFEETIAELVRIEVHFAAQNMRSIESTGSYRFVQNLIKLINATSLSNKNLPLIVSLAASLIRIIL